MGSEVTTVGELDALGTAVGAGLDNVLTDLDVRMIEYGDDALVHHRGENFHAIMFHVVSPLSWNLLNSECLVQLAAMIRSGIADFGIMAPG
jgi:hypothetical protein